MRHYNFSDITKFGITNSSERYFWVTYFLFVFTSSIIGDSLILLASVQEGAFKVNKSLVTVIQHIAICDITSSITTVLPGGISLVADGWVLGDMLCHLRLYVGNFAYLAGMSLIAVLTTSKFLILKYPLRAAKWMNRRTVHQVCCVIWGSVLVNTIVKLGIDKDDVYFDYRIYMCWYGFNSESWKILKLLPAFIFGLIPNVVIVATTVPTLKYLAAARKSARRAQGSVPWQGALTVALTSIVYCTSTLPYVANYIVQSFLKTNYQDRLSVKFYRITYFLLLVNIMSNFYICTLTIRSFRQFVLDKFVSCREACFKFRRQRTQVIGMGFTLALPATNDYWVFFKTNQLKIPISPNFCRFGVFHSDLIT